MIAFQDFVPEQIKPARFFTQAEYEEFEAALARANQWIAQNKVDVVNIETVVLPNMWDESGPKDTSLHDGGKWQATWHQFIRVWYRKEG